MSSSRWPGRPWARAGRGGGERGGVRVLHFLLPLLPGHLADTHSADLSCPSQFPTRSRAVAKLHLYLLPAPHPGPAHSAFDSGTSASGPPFVVLGDISLLLRGAPARAPQALHRRRTREVLLLCAFVLRRSPASPPGVLHLAARAEKHEASFLTESPGSSRGETKVCRARPTRRPSS